VAHTLRESTSLPGEAADMARHGRREIGSEHDFDVDLARYVGEPGYRGAVSSPLVVCSSMRTLFMSGPRKPTRTP
jgi:hypothetical protein